MAKNVIQFKGQFDGKQVLDALKKIRESMANAGANSSLFTNIDKDIVKTEKLVNDMLAQIQKGFSNPNEIKAFEKQLEKMGLAFSKINVGLQDVNEASNFKVNANEVKQYQQELDKLVNKQESLQQAAKNSIKTQLENAKLTKKEREAILEEVKAQGDLEGAIEKVAKAKEKAAKSKHGTKALEEGGKDFVDSTGAGLDVASLGAKATTKAKKRGHEDLRVRTAGGNYKTKNGERVLDVDKTNVTIIDNYRKSLEEVIKTGGSAADAVELMKKAMDSYGVELTNADKLQEDFARDLDEFTNTQMSIQQRGAISRAQTLGSTDVSGSFHMSQAGQNIVNNAEAQEYQNLLQDIVTTSNNVANATERMEQANEDYSRTATQALNRADADTKELTESTEKSIDAMKESSDAAEKLDNSFENMKQAVKTFLSISSAVGALKNVITQTFDDVQNLDEAFAGIAMVTDYSVEQMWGTYDQYADMAAKMGQSTENVVRASGLFYQQGLDTNESLALTEDTMKLATLANANYEQSTEYMTAALRGFHMEMDQGNRITDVYSELAAKAAADVQGIANAMSKTASIANSAGMEFETTSAFLTQMINVI